jgi:hypothetical protein
VPGAALRTKRIVAAAAVPVLVTGFVLVDVVSLPGGDAGPVTPDVTTVAVGGSSWRIVSSAQAAETPPTADPTADPTAGPDATAEPDATSDATSDATAEGDVLVSETLETGDFLVAGVRWDADDVEPTDIRVRIREEGGWSAWQVLETNDEGPDPGTPEYQQARHVVGTDPIITAGADAIQVRVDVPDGGEPPDVDVVTIDPGTGPADGTTVERTPLTSAAAAMSAPSMMTRAQWGADESLRNCSPSYSSTIRAATIHHTAGTNSYTAAQGPSIVRGVYAYHTRSLGWCDVGYNFLVDKFGRIYEGRFGGIGRAVRGAHAGGFNDRTFGVAAMGNYETATAPAAMVTSIGRLVGWKLARYGVNPMASTTLTSAGGGTAKYTAGTTVSLPTVFAHRDVGYTACPGINLFSRMGGIRDLARILTERGYHVRALYLDMLGREPAGGEIEFWEPIAGRDRWRAANGFTTSEEYRRRYIAAAYQDVLGRGPDPAGTRFWLDRLQSQQVRLDDIRPTFMNSQEFYLRGGGTDAGFVQELYRRALGRSAAASEVSYWTGQFPSRGRAGVIASIYGSAESARIRVDRAYREWLRRPAAAGERVYWEQTVLSRGDEYMRMSVMVSQEYVVKARSL